MMRFRDYLRWDGGLAVVSGVALVAVGLREGHQAAGDAVFGGALMLTGTGLFMLVRHRLALRDPGGWYTTRSLSAAQDQLPPCAQVRLLATLVAVAAAGAVVLVVLSHLTGFWLTYMDCGVWAVAVGAIKLGPAAAAVVHHETRERCTFHVARRPLGGPVQLTRTPVRHPSIDPGGT